MRRGRQHPQGGGMAGERAVSATVAAEGGAEPPARGSHERQADVRPEALRGVKVPARTRQGRRWVYRLYNTCPWLSLPDVPAAARLGDLYTAISRLSARLDTGGLVKADGAPLKPLSEWRALLAEARAHEAAWASRRRPGPPWAWTWRASNSSTWRRSWRAVVTGSHRERAGGGPDRSAEPD